MLLTGTFFQELRREGGSQFSEAAAGSQGVVPVRCALTERGDRKRWNSAAENHKDRIGHALVSL